MRAWTVDADDIRVAEDFDAALLHRTPEIDDFLSHGGDKFVVIGTKGFGKTLLLKAKRVLYQSGGVVCLPDRSLLDKPIGDKVFSKEAISIYADSPLWWSKVWLTSIALATLKRLDRAAGLEVGPRLKSLLLDPDLRGVIDHFVRLLDFPPGELQRCANETDGYLVPRLRAIDVPVAIFIDSVDEYFNKHVESGAGRASAAGELAPNIWYFSQLGLVEVGYQLRRINHHLKVFAAVRKEAFLRLPDSTVMSQQYHGSAVDIAYTPESLREIFVSNIRREPASRLVLPDRVKDDPLTAYFGTTHVTHGFTGEREDVFAYVCRHTLLRPRDFMTIGQRISALKPSERTEDRIKTAVNAAATEIAHEYLREIAPYLGGLDLNDLLARIPGHILTRDEIEALFCDYNDAAGALPGDELHVCCALYRAGLLGWLEHDMVDGTRRQRFLRPGEGTFEPDGVLPRSTHYLVHPVLSQVIARLNHGYAERIDRVNVVGSGRPWRDPNEPRAETLAVMQADVRGMLGLMERGMDAPVRRAIEEAVARHADRARSREITEGDHVLITHHDAAALARIARRIVDDVYDAPGQPLLRVALHYGEVRLQTSGTTAVVTGGHAIAVAARIEPRVTPGEIWCTEDFCEALEQSRSLCRTVVLEPPAGTGGEGERAGCFNVRKDGSDEADIWVRLYRVEF
ncbi:MAG TPA: hypothetical protein VIS07_08730 [Candidatus Binatia bacterium]